MKRNVVIILVALAVLGLLVLGSVFPLLMAILELGICFVSLVLIVHVFAYILGY